MSGVAQLGYLGISVSNMDAWEDLLQNVLGMEIVERATDGTVYARMDEHHHRIALYPTGKDDMIYAGWQTRTRKDFEEVKVKLLALGVEYQQATPDEIGNRHVMDMVKFDLSGIQTEVYMGPHVMFERPFRPGRAITGFKTGVLGLGHVGLNLSKPEDFTKTVRILQEALGFLPSDAGAQGPERFFHVNPREHSAVVGANPSGKKIGHFMVELNSLDDVGRAQDMCDERGIWIQQRLGKHTNDHMTSFYLETPSGFGIEYGFGGRLIDDSTWEVTKHDRFSMWGHRRPQKPATAEEADVVRKFLTPNSAQRPPAPATR